MNKINVEFVATESVELSGFNPQNRAVISTRDELYKSMQEDGFHAYQPILLSKDGKIGDGHRRYFCAKLLEITNIPVIKTDKTVQELMANNGTMRTWKTPDWDDASTYGTSIPASVKRAHEILLDCAGKDALSIVKMYKKSSSIAPFLRKLMNYIHISNNIEWGKRALIWMLSNAQQRAVNDAIADNISEEILIAAISNNFPLQRGKWTIQEQNKKEE